MIKSSYHIEIIDRWCNWTHFHDDYFISSEDMNEAIAYADKIVPLYPGARVIHTMREVVYENKR